MVLNDVYTEHRSCTIHTRTIIWNRNKVFVRFLFELIFCVMLNLTFFLFPMYHFIYELKVNIIFMKLSFIFVESRNLMDQSAKGIASYIVRTTFCRTTSHNDVHQKFRICIFFLIHFKHLQGTSKVSLQKKYSVNCDYIKEKYQYLPTYLL